MKSKYVYLFGDGKADGSAEMKNLLGGKGANLAEMARIGIPVPPGFTITTEVCAIYSEKGRDAAIPLIRDQVEAGIRHIETVMNAEFGGIRNPLLVSVRSGARVSMPGMMDTVLNIGLNEDTIQGLVEKSGNERFPWDCYRRLIQMYGDVVLGMKPEKKDDIDPFEKIMDEIKERDGIENDAGLSVGHLKELVERFKTAVRDNTGREFPTDPWDQLWGAVEAVFGSWNSARAIVYRKLNGIPEDWGTAVNVQAMVFGNMGEDSATGVAFTRDAATGENIFNGEYLINAQGEDVVAGIRTPQQITLEGSRRWAALAGVSEEERKNQYPSLEETMPEIYRELCREEQKLENHYREMQDLEFTIQNRKLWILQTRTGKRTGTAMVRIAMEMLDEGMIDEKTALLRMEPEKLNELLHPVFDKDALARATVLAKGLPASPGAATGRIVFFADEAETWKTKGEDVILVRIETSPEDLAGMNAATGVLTARGGMTSHAAVVARGMGKCCVCGAASLVIDYKKRTVTVGDRVLKQGDWISLNGTTGEVFEGKVATCDPELSGNFEKLMTLCSRFTRLGVRSNADTPHDSKVARNFGAQGIGLCRTEHMFFQPARIIAVREMILSDDEAGRRNALDKLLPMQRKDFDEIFVVMNGLPVTIRLLDPPLHEFVPHDEKSQKEMADEMGVPLDKVQEKVVSLQEFNPMLGHRGCRLGNTYPEITEMQTRAIIEAALDCKKRGIDAKPEIMVPLVSTREELARQAAIIRTTAETVFEERGERVDFLLGTMIEVPRAALTADEIAELAEFFSFGTNDLTQMTFGFSRDDAGKFLPFYIENGILTCDPFQVVDQEGVGRLVRMGVEKGRTARPGLKTGVCGEHGGDPNSVKFFHRTGLDYVSCSPYRVPIARLAAAQAAIED